MALSDKISLNESLAEGSSLDLFGEPDDAVGNEPYLAPGEPDAEGDSFGECCLYDAAPVGTLQYPTTPEREDTHLITLNNRVRSAVR